MDVTTRSRKSRSWLTSRTVPGYSDSSSCSRSSVSRSRSLVGSSRISRLDGRASAQASSSRPALAAGQHADGGARLLRAEQEVLHVAHHVAFLAGDRHLVAIAAGQRVLQGARRVECRALLVQRHRQQVGAERDRAAIGLVAAGQQPQQRGLAGAVAPDDAQPVSAEHAQGQVVHDWAFAIAPADVVGHHDLLAGQLALRRRHLQARTAGSAHLPPLGPQRRQFRNPAHVALAPRGDAVGDPVLLAHDLAVQLLAVPRVLFGHFLAPGLEMLEAAVHPPGHAGFQPDHAAADGLQHAAVVADQHDAGAGGGKLLLQPFDRRQVQVVGRLVQQQQVGGGGEGTGQGRAPCLTARQVRRVFGTGQAQAVQQGWAAMLILAGADAILHIVQRRGEAGQVGLLRQVADRGAGLQEARTAIRPHQPGGDLQQRGLAGAIAAHQADALAGTDADGGTVQQCLCTEGGADILQQ